MTITMSSRESVGKKEGHKGTKHACQEKRRKKTRAHRAGMGVFEGDRRAGESLTGHRGRLLEERNKGRRRNSTVHSWKQAGGRGELQRSGPNG